MWCRNTESFWNCCFIGWIALRYKLHVWATIAVTTATVAAAAATAAAAHFCNISARPKTLDLCYGFFSLFNGSGFFALAFLQFVVGFSYTFACNPFHCPHVFVEHTRKCTTFSIRNENVDVRENLYAYTHSRAFRRCLPSLHCSRMQFLQCALACALRTSDW